MPSKPVDCSYEDEFSEELCCVVGIYLVRSNLIGTEM